MDIGIDIGTSEVKVVLIDVAQCVVGQGHSAVPMSRPQLLWSEQDLQDWWTATADALAQLRATHPTEYGATRSIGLPGHRHGATLLDAHDRVLRPARLDRRNGPRSVQPSARRRLGRLACSGASIASVCTAPAIVDSFEPNPRRSEALAARHAQFQRRYATLGQEMRPPR